MALTFLSKDFVDFILLSVIATAVYTDILIPCIDVKFFPMRKSLILLLILQPQSSLLSSLQLLSSSVDLGNTFGYIFTMLVSVA